MDNYRTMTTEENIAINLEGGDDLSSVDDTNRKEILWDTDIEENVTKLKKEYIIKQIYHNKYETIYKIANKCFSFFIIVIAALQGTI